MAALLFLTLSLLHAHDGTNKLFKISRGSGPSSYLFGTDPDAYVARHEPLPLEVRRALQKSRVLILEKDGALGQLPVPSRRSKPPSLGVLDQLSTPARHFLHRLSSPEEYEFYDGLEPGVVLLSCLAKVIALQQLRDEAYRTPKTLRLDGQIRAITQAVLGPEAEERDLWAAGERAASEAAVAGQTLTEALVQAGRRTKMELRWVGAEEADKTSMTMLSALITAADLDRGLLFLAGERDREGASARKRRFVLKLLGKIVAANYLRVQNRGVLDLRGQNLYLRMGGLERMRTHLVAHHLAWKTTLLRKIEEGGAFIAVDLSHVWSESLVNVVGLKRLLELEGLDVTGVNINCGSLLL